MGLSKDALGSLIEEHTRQHKEMLLCEREVQALESQLENKRLDFSVAKRNKAAFRRILKDNGVDMKAIDAELRKVSVE